MEFHDCYRSVLGAVAWVAFTRAHLAVYMQVLQRRVNAPRIQDCKRLHIVIRYFKRHKCGLRSIRVKHPLELVTVTDAAFTAQPDEPMGLVLQGLAAILCEDREGDAKANSTIGKANLADFTARRRRRVVRRTFSAELNGLVDSIEQMLLL